MKNTEYEVPDTIKNYTGNFIIAGCRKGAIDGMPSNLQLRAFKNYENLKKWIDTIKFDVFGPKVFFDELAYSGEARFSDSTYCFVVKLDNKCKNFYID